MLRVDYTAKFKKDYKRVKKQGKDLGKLKDALTRLANQEDLPESMHDHALVGSYRGHRECHIEPDWLLIYLVDDDELVLTATRTGSHSELLGM